MGAEGEKMFKGCLTQYYLLLKNHIGTHYQPQVKPFQAVQVSCMDKFQNSTRKERMDKTQSTYLHTCTCTHDKIFYYVVQSPHFEIHNCRPANILLQSTDYVPRAFLCSTLSVSIDIVPGQGGKGSPSPQSPIPSPQSVEQGSSFHPM